MRQRVSQLLVALKGSRQNTSHSRYRHLSTKDFVILDPRQARVLPTKRRRWSEKRDPVNTDDSRHQLLEELNELDSELREAAPRDTPSTVTRSLDAQRPANNVLSQQMYEKTLEGIRRGFSKPQLQKYLEEKNVHVARTLNKTQLALDILSRVWSVRPEEHRPSNSALVENIIELDEKEFLLLIAHGGRTLREWSKSGASISLFPGKRQIMVRSSPETFQWILAKLSNFEGQIRSYRIDLRRYSEVVDLSPIDFRLMQLLTDSYFSNVTSDGFVVWTTSRRDARLVSRLLLWLLPMAKWRPVEYFYDTNEANLSSCRFRKFADTDALDWTHRSSEWSRFEIVKQREQGKFFEQKLAQLKPPSFAQNSAEVSSTGRSFREQVSSLIDDFYLKDIVTSDEKTGCLTLMVTMGYLLHNADETSLLPNAGMKRTFCTNIPHAEKLAGKLPLFSRDIAQEPCRDGVLPLEADTHGGDHSSATSDAKLDPWEFLLKGDSHESVYTMKRKDIEDMNLKLAQFKLVPSPHEVGESDENAILQYPPIEVWCPFMDERSLRTDDARVVIVEKESSKFISLPQEVADLRLTLARTKSLPLSEATKSFLGKARFDPVMPRGAYIQNELSVDIGSGKVVKYLCQCVTLVTQAELEFNGALLQLAQTEGGKLGGRQIETGLVYHVEDSQNFDLNDAKSILYNALDALSSLKEA